MICRAKSVPNDVCFTNRLVVCRVCHNMAVLWISNSCYFVYSQVAGFGALFNARQDGLLARGEVEGMVDSIAKSGLPEDALINVGQSVSLHRDIHNQLTGRERLFLQKFCIREECE